MWCSQVLVDNGANIEAVNTFGMTPLHTAAMGSHVEPAKVVNAMSDFVTLVAHVQLLINYGANITAVDHQGAQPLHRAIRLGHANIAKVMSHRALIPPANRTDLQCLIDHGADVNAVTHKGWTALHQAAYYNCIEIVEVTPYLFNDSL